MIVRFQRVGGRVPPPDRESLQVDDDGSFVLWRSTYSPVVGRFAGRLASAEITRLREEAEQAEAAGPQEMLPPPDGAVETFAVGEASATLGQHQRPDGAWAVLVDDVRRIVRDKIDEPAAAIGLEHDGPEARLVHRGIETVDVDLGNAVIRVVQWDRNNEKIGDWSSRATGARASAGPGWSFALPFDHGLAERADAKLHVYVGFILYDGKVPVDVQIVDAP